MVNNLWPLSLCTFLPLIWRGVCFVRSCATYDSTFSLYVQLLQARSTFVARVDVCSSVRPPRRGFRVPEAIVVVFSTWRRYRIRSRATLYPACVLYRAGIVGKLLCSIRLATPWHDAPAVARYVSSQTTILVFRTPYLSFSKYLPVWWYGLSALISHQYDKML